VQTLVRYAAAASRGAMAREVRKRTMTGHSLGSGLVVDSEPEFPVDPRNRQNRCESAWCVYRDLSASLPSQSTVRSRSRQEEDNGTLGGLLAVECPGARSCRNGYTADHVDD